MQLFGCMLLWTTSHLEHVLWSLGKPLLHLETFEILRKKIQHVNFFSVFCYFNKMKLPITWFYLAKQMFWIISHAVWHIAAKVTTMSFLLLLLLSGALVEQTKLRFCKSWWVDLASDCSRKGQTLKIQKKYKKNSAHFQHAQWSA